MRTRLALALIAGAIFCAVLAQEPLPAGAAILDKYIEVTGGRAAYEKLRTQVTTMTAELAAQGLRFTMTVYRAAPNKSYVVMEMPGVGKMEDGTDGQVYWSLSALQGPRIKEGDERALGEMSTAFNADLRWRELFNSAETLGIEDVDGHPCYKVQVTSKAGLKQTRYYDQKTGLLVKSAMVMKTQMGEIPTESAVSDYKNVDGILMPHKNAMKLMGQNLVTVVDSVKNNVEIEASRFALPDEIKALRAKPESKPEKK